MTTRERILKEPCACGAEPGERCRPFVLSGGYHGARLLAAGGVIRPELRGVEYVPPPRRCSKP